MFKIGQKVKCIEGNDINLHDDRIYTIETSNSRFVSLKERPGIEWYRSRFVDISERDSYLEERTNELTKLEEKILNKENAAHPKDVGSKHDSGKPRMELIPTEFLIETAKALTFGSKKYGDHNFRKGLSYSRLLGAAKRHIELELATVESDLESGESHLAHAAASLAMYAFMKTHKKDLDDRFKYTEEEKKALEEMMYDKKPNS